MIHLFYTYSVILICIFSFDVSFAGVLELSQADRDILTMPSHKAACLPTAASIQSEVKSFDPKIKAITQKYFEQIQINSLKQPEKTTENQHDIGIDLKFRVITRQFAPEYKDQQTMDCQIASALTYKTDSEIAKSLQLEEFGTEGANGVNALNYQEQVSTNDFKNIKIYIGPPPDEVIDWNCSCTKIKLMLDDEIKLFEDLFDKDCKNHVVIGPDGKPHIRMFHGTPHTSLELFEEYGIKDCGNGDLGRGFYLTTTFEQAGFFSFLKCHKNSGKAFSVMEILVPFGLSVKKYMNGFFLYTFFDNILRPTDTGIEQHYKSNYSNKFVFRKAILHKLRANTQYITPSDNETQDIIAQEQWRKSGKSQEEIKKIVQKLKTPPPKISSTQDGNLIE